MPTCEGGVMDRLLDSSGAAATVNTRSCWARVIPQVTTGSTVRTANSATSCTSSVNDSVDNNNPANSGSAGLRKGEIFSDIESTRPASPRPAGPA